MMHWFAEWRGEADYVGEEPENAVFEDAEEEYQSDETIGVAIWLFCKPSNAKKSKKAAIEEWNKRYPNAKRKIAIIIFFN